MAKNVVISKKLHFFYIYHNLSQYKYERHFLKGNMDLIHIGNKKQD